VIEDSLPGVQSAVAAGMQCVAATTELTRAAVHAAGVLPPARIVDDPARLAAVVLPLVEDAGGDARAARALA
jgi:beta-phosphoglucomutase-like phosphatase (HAD superfamily)